MNSYPNLLSPLTIRGKTYRNRITAAPVNGVTIREDGTALPEELEKFKRKAVGMAASVCLGETVVDFDYAQRLEITKPFDYSDYGTPQFKCFRSFADAIHTGGALAFIELFHSGQCRLAEAGYNEAIGPSSKINEDGVKVREMDEAMMERVAENFGIAALFMKKAGFDGVMLHGGHGWLIHQFLSPNINHRTDSFGGSIENRARFPVQIVRKVREMVGEDFLIELRLSGSDWTDGGVVVEDSAVFAHLAEAYVDVIHVSAGEYHDPVMTRQVSSMYHEHGCNAYEAKVIKESVSIPVALVGGINSPEQAEELLSAGVCDLVAMGRQFTADPNFVQKVIEGNSDDIARCIRCFRCFPGPFEAAKRLGLLKPGCTVNPYFERQLSSYKETLSGQNRKVLIVGGGVAGMQAAITAADRGYQVTLVEKEKKLGGILFFTDTDTYKTDLKNFKNLLISRVQKRSIKVILGREADQKLIQEIVPDMIILAVGSQPFFPSIEGLNMATPVLEVYRGAPVKRSAVILGGGLAGCEVALHLAALGHRVTIVEMKTELAPDAYPTHRTALLAKLKDCVECRTGLECCKVQSDGVYARNQDGEVSFFQADTVICAMGMRADDKAVEQLKQAAGEIPVVAVGDCVKARTVYYAVYEATTAVLQL